MTDGPIILRYFPVLGRAQAIRHSLADAGVDFEDLRIPLSDWTRHRDDPAFSGRFRALPTLTWGSATVSETLPIATFVSKRLGQYDGLGDEAICHREAICSSTYIDVLLRCADVIRADVMYPGGDVRAGFAAIAGRIGQKMDLLDSQIPDTSWIGGDRPAVADFFATEAFEVMRYVLGHDRDDALRRRLPRLARLSHAVRHRPQLAGARENRPTRFTGRPDEDRIVERLRTTELSSAGF